MNKDIAFVCSRLSPGPRKVIKNLRGILKGTTDTTYIPLEDLFIPRLHFKTKHLGSKYLRLQERLQFINIAPLLKTNTEIIFAGWGAANNVILKKLNEKGITPSIIMCSTVGQSDFNSFERNRLLQVFENTKKGRIRYLLLNKRLYESLGKELPRSVYFPHTIDLSKFQRITPRELSGINIDIFYSMRPGKNVMNQIFAVKLAHRPISLHINFDNTEITKFSGELGINPIIHGWIDEPEYYSLIAGMTLSLQVTFTESFNYAVSERMSLSVPTLTSFDIYLTSEDPFLSKHLCIQKLDTPAEMAGCLRRILDDTSLQIELSRQCRTRIKSVADKNNTIAKDFLNSNL